MFAQQVLYRLNCHEGAMTMFDKLCRKGWSSSAHRTAKWGSACLRQWRHRLRAPLLTLPLQDKACRLHSICCYLAVLLWFFSIIMFLLLILLCYILYYPTSALFARRIFGRLLPIHSSCISSNTYDYPVSLLCVWLFRC